MGSHLKEELPSENSFAAVEKNWNDAKSTCESIGGQLFEPKTLGINNQVYEKAREIIGKSNYVWVGYKVRGTRAYGSNLSNTVEWSVPFEPSWYRYPTNGNVE